MNLARLNHILIPSTAAERERWRLGVIGRLTRPGWWLYSALSEEGRVLSVLVLFIGTAGLDVATTQVYYLWAALMGLLVASVAVRPWLSLGGVEAEVRVPPRVAVDTPTTFSVLLHNRGERDHHSVRVRGPFLPWDGQWRGREPRLAELPAGASERTALRATFIRRGRHHLDPFRACAVVPLGLAVGPTIRTESCHFMVVPRVAAIDRLSLPSGTTRDVGGRTKTSFTGEAMELRGVRPYRPGDPVRNLHAKLWARHGTPHVREFQQEVFSRVGILFDDGKLDAPEEGFEGAISLAAGVVAKVIRGDTLVDLVFASGEQPTVTCGQSSASLDQALDALADCPQRAGWQLGEVVNRLERTIDSLSCVVVVTASSHPSRLGLVSALASRGVACRVLRVEDDVTPRWLAFGREPVPARSKDEVVLSARAIRDGETQLL